jgi:hypothetical protein
VSVAASVSTGSRPRSLKVRQTDMRMVWGAALAGVAEGVLAGDGGGADPTLGSVLSKGTFYST